MSNRIVKLPSVESFGRLTPDKWLLLKTLEEAAAYLRAEGRAAYQAWLKEHDRQIAEKAWEEGYIHAVKNMNPMPGEESPEYTPNPYRKENA